MLSLYTLIDCSVQFCIPEFSNFSISLWNKKSCFACVYIMCFVALYHQILLKIVIFLFLIFFIFFIVFYLKMSYFLFSLFYWLYLPRQNLEKISLIISSVASSPVISPKLLNTSFKEMAIMSIGIFSSKLFWASFKFLMAF